MSNCIHHISTSSDGVTIVEVVLQGVVPDPEALDKAILQEVERQHAAHRIEKRARFVSQYSTGKPNLQFLPKEVPVSVLMPGKLCPECGGRGVVTSTVRCSRGCGS